MSFGIQSGMLRYKVVDPVTSDIIYVTGQSASTDTSYMEFSSSELGVQENDLLIYMSNSRNSPVSDAPCSTCPWVKQYNIDISTNEFVGAWTRLVTSSEPTHYRFDFNRLTSSSACIGSIVVIRGKESYTITHKMETIDYNVTNTHTTEPIDVYSGGIAIGHWGCSWTGFGSNGYYHPEFPDGFTEVHIENNGPNVTRQAIGYQLQTENRVLPSKTKTQTNLVAYNMAGILSIY